MVVHELVLLGAGASLHAGVPLTSGLTEDVVGRALAEARLTQERTQTDVVAEHRKLQAAAEGGDPLALERLATFESFMHAMPVAPLERTSALAFVYGRLRGLAAERNDGSGDAPLDLEALVTVLDQLASVSAGGIAPFVSSWDPRLIEVDHGNVGWIIGHPIEKYDFALANFVERIVDSRLTLGSGAPFAGAVEQLKLALPGAITVDRGRCDYLIPLAEWAARSRGRVVATLNYDQTVDIAAELAGLRVDDGFGAWPTALRFGWANDADVRLLRLHGSLAWIDKVDTPFLLGGLNKLHAVGPYIEMLGALRLEAVAAERIVVVGYSFRDPHINAVLGEGLAVRRRQGRRTIIDVVDPKVDVEAVRIALGVPDRDDLPAKSGVTIVAGYASQAERVLGDLLDEAHRPRPLGP